MKNITLAVDEGVLVGARLYAVERRTSINALFRKHLEHLTTRTNKMVGADAKREARRNLKRLAEQ